MPKKIRLLTHFLIFSIAVALCLLFSHTYQKVIEAGKTVSTSLYSKHLIVDAGHGGFDGGATGVNGVLEKEINLKIAQKTASLARLSGFTVVMVRDSDTGTNDNSTKSIREKKVSDMHNRLALTEKYPNAIYFSIHQNTFPDESCNGAQVFYGEKNPDSKVIAEQLQSVIKSQIQNKNERKVKPAQKNLYLLYNSKIPTVLLECGFLSNYDECNKLCDSGYQQNIAFCAVTSLMDSLNLT